MEATQFPSLHNFGLVESEQMQASRLSDLEQSLVIASPVGEAGNLAQLAAVATQEPS